MSSITLKKNFVYITISKDEIHIIKKDCILGYKGTSYINLLLTIYTNIPGAKICIECGVGVEGNKEYHKYTEILDNILSPEVPEVVQQSDNMLKN